MNLCCADRWADVCIQTKSSIQTQKPIITGQTATQFHWFLLQYLKSCSKPCGSLHSWVPTYTSRVGPTTSSLPDGNHHDPACITWHLLASKYSSALLRRQGRRGFPSLPCQKRQTTCNFRSLWQTQKSMWSCMGVVCSGKSLPLQAYYTPPSYSQAAKVNHKFSIQVC